MTPIPRLRALVASLGLGAALALGPALPAGAVSLELTPTSPSPLSAVPISETVELLINTSSNFPSFTSGGFDLSYNADILSYEGATNTAGFFAFEDRDQLGDTATGATTIANITFSTFGTTLGADTSLLVLTFTALAPGTTTITLTEATNDANRFFNGSVGLGPVGFPTADVTVILPSTVIPLPASAWLMLGALGALGLVRRRKRESLPPPA
ncbi:MAG: VPLPA-CTERM sorting domain-containing protein [Pseudomonadota bacterium]